MSRPFVLVIVVIEWFTLENIGTKDIIDMLLLAGITFHNMGILDKPVSVFGRRATL